MGSLKPCPFCGGEAQLILALVPADPADNDNLVSLCHVVACKRCKVMIGRVKHGATDLFHSPSEAADTWNNRSERTCRRVPGKMVYGERRPKCSECGYGIGDARWGFCPSCGAKITPREVER